jgi:hypothetical protein
MARKFITGFALLIITALLNSCLLRTTESLRQEIIKENPDVKSVGIILDWTNSDNKFIALDLILKNNRSLFLTLVNYRKLSGRDPFYLNRVGNYAFATIEHFIDKKTNRTKTRMRTRKYSLSMLSVELGISINTMHDIIKYCGNIYDFAESLPAVTESNYQEMLEEGKLIKGENNESDYYFIETYYAKTIWKNEYYGYEWKDGKEKLRKPDYSNNRVLAELYFWGT